MNKRQWDWDDWKSLFDRNFNISMDEPIEATGESLANEPRTDTSGPGVNATLNAGAVFELFQTAGSGRKAEVGDIWHMPFIGYKRIPRYLAGLTLLREDRKPIRQDHHEYWRAAGAFASQFMSLPQVRMDLEGKPRLRGDLDIDMLRDLCVLLQLLESRTIGESLKRSYFLQREDPPPLQQTWMRMGTYVYQIGSVNSAAVLEGLLRRRSSVLTSDGTRKDDGEIEKDKLDRADELINRRRAYIFDALRIWLEFDATDQVKRTIVEIENLADSEYTPSDDSIRSQYSSGEIPDRTPADLLNIDQNIDKEIEELISKDGFFFDLRDVRNRAAHREGFIRSMCSVITSVACLVFWDAIDETTFKRIKEMIRSNQTQAGVSDHPYAGFSNRRDSDFTPPCFYGPWLRTFRP